MDIKESQVIQHSWVCLTCDSEVMPHNEFIVHLKEKHNLNMSLRGQRTLVMHLDQAECYSSTYRWEFGDLNVSASEFIQMKRDKNDPMGESYV